MKKILYKAPGAMLVTGPDGALVRKEIDATAELPFSEENLHTAESAAHPGSIEVLVVQGTSSAEPQLPNAATDEPLDHLVLTDRTSGKRYELFVDNGKLMMEVL